MYHPRYSDSFEVAVEDEAIIKRLVEFPSDTGEAVVVEIEDLQPRGGPRRDLATSVVVERAHNSFEDTLEKARPLASGLISRLQKRIADSPGELPDQVQIEFGGFAGSSFRAYYFCNVVQGTYLG